MPDWLNYKGIEVPDATPTGAGGLRLKDDLTELADRVGPVHAAASDPTADDDGDDTGGHGAFYVWSKWLNTSTGATFVCTDNSTGAAVWKRTDTAKNNLTASVPPTEDDDDTLGYEPGSQWFDSSHPSLYVCESASTGAAVWNQVAAVRIANASPTADDDVDAGFNPGALWFNSSTYVLFICLNNTSGSASWYVISVPHTSSSLPTVNDDVDAGYVVGSLWFNTTSFATLICMGNSSGSAGWYTISVPRVASSSPTASDDESYGYVVGSMWYNQVTNVLYICRSNGSSSAAWDFFAGNQPLNNFVASGAPTANDDSGDGYSRGSRWNDGSDEYVCTDPMATMAVWKQIT